ncbi:MAG: hypothetical protein IT385_20700 [Deltaproteobacteria bacterium]|nr:hypothetical protein [Deltaproteobacteria bacterium]
MSHAHVPTLTAEQATLKPESLWRKFPLAGLVIGAGCLVLAYVLGESHMHTAEGDKTTHTQFYYSYITSYMFWVAVALGCLFFVLIQHGTRAGWSTVLRRIAENWMMTLPVFAVLMVPIILGAHDTFHWTHRVPGQDLILDRKAPYLDEGFFQIRSVAVVLIWCALAYALYRWSTRQDKTGDIALSHKMRWWAPLGFVIFAITVTIAAIDWMMSLQPHWYSTIFGVNYFSGCVMVSGAVLALTAMALQKSGVLQQHVTTEHYHDLGKWSFAFLVFWSYTAVSQLLLIWYANIPEETIYYHQRVQGGWEVISILLALFHFAIPFWFLMSRHVKRKKTTLAIGAVMVIIAHYIDMFWIVQPNMALTLDHTAHPHFSMHIADILTLVGIGAVALGAFAWVTTRTPVAPIKDPRLAESLRFENQ